MSLFKSVQEKIMGRPPGITEESLKTALSAKILSLLALSAMWSLAAAT